VNVFVLDPHAIYRRGLVASLELIDEVVDVAYAETVDEATGHPACASADLVIVDVVAPGAEDFIRATRARVIVCTDVQDDDSVLGALRAGAIGYLSKATLTSEALEASVRAATSGAGVMAPELLGGLGANGGSARRFPTPLSDREQAVLSLIAEGYPTREVAVRLSYSERTVKNILHDVVAKLNARSRSQAVAEAVRAGLI
jgi:DNA-binding NarL/FixJ family response regulator